MSGRTVADEIRKEGQGQVIKSGWTRHGDAGGAAGRLSLDFWFVTLDGGDSWDCRRRPWIQSRTCQVRGAAAAACKARPPGPSGPLHSRDPQVPLQPLLCSFPSPQPGPPHECVFSSSVGIYTHSSCCCNKPQTQWLKTTQIYFSIVLHGQSPKRTTLS